MSQKATKEQMPALIAEVVNRQKNLDSLEALKKFCQRISVTGAEVIELGQAMVWLDGIINGENTRIAEIKAQLPEKDTEIQLTEAGPETPPDAAVAEQPATSGGGVEISKGSEVLQPA